VEQERAVGDVLDVDSRDVTDRGQDPVEVLAVAGHDGDVADLVGRLDAHEVDCSEQPARGGDRRCQRGERAWMVLQADPDGRAERRGGMGRDGR
jgi:hypothetical protein